MNGPGRWIRLAIPLGAAFALGLSAPPEGLSRDAWTTFAIFVGVVLGFLLRPIEMAPIVLLGLCSLVVTTEVDATFAIASGFGNKTVWLVVSAFLIAGAVARTGLGRRIALHLIRLLGRSTLGLGYAIAASELILGPFVPSNTARGGGILSPIVRGLAHSLGSEPGTPEVSTGAYLIQTASHSNLVCAATFLTAMAGNALLVPLASDIFAVEWTFALWLQGSIAPALVGLAAVPLVLHVLEPPASRDVSHVRAEVASRIEELGRWTRPEISVVVVLVGLLVGWSWGAFHSTIIALLGVLAIVLSGAQRWREVAATWGAWDALIWLGGFVTLAEALKETGFTDWLRVMIEARVTGLPPVLTVVALGLFYFATMLLFSQLTAHITALAGVFLALAHAARAPDLLSIAVISYFSSLCGAMTPWSSGPVIIYFQFGYVSVGRWIRNGVCVALVQIAVWLTVGLLWWRAIGWW